jgi:hypothetical protein
MYRINSFTETTGFISPQNAGASGFSGTDGFEAEQAATTSVPQQQQSVRVRTYEFSMIESDDISGGTPETAGRSLVQRLEVAPSPEGAAVCQLGSGREPPWDDCRRTGQPSRRCLSRVRDEPGLIQPSMGRMRAGWRRAD